MNDEIKNIPELPEDLRQAINGRKLAIFIGAGVSRFVGCDSWDTLAKNLLERCRKEGFITYFEQQTLSKNNDKIKLITICEHILEKEGKQDIFMDEMRKSLKDDEITNLNKDKIEDALNSNNTSYSKEQKKIYSGLKAYKNLREIGDIFITTNADRYFDSFFHPTKIIKDYYNIVTSFIDEDSNKINPNLSKTIPSEIDPNPSEIDLDSGKLYKIHGCISTEDSLVFSMYRYIKQYSRSDFNEFIKSIFKKYTVLFVGYSLNEMELLKNIIVSEKEHFYLKGYFDCEDKILNLDRQYFKGLRVKLIPFAKDKKGYEQLKYVIDDWHKKIKKETRKTQNSLVDIDNALENPS